MRSIYKILLFFSTLFIGACSRQAPQEKVKVIYLYPCDYHGDFDPQDFDISEAEE